MGASSPSVRSSRGLRHDPTKREWEPLRGSPLVPPRVGRQGLVTRLHGRVTDLIRRPQPRGLADYEAEATFQRYPSGSLKYPKYPHGEAAASLTTPPPAPTALPMTSSTSLLEGTM